MSAHALIDASLLRELDALRQTVRAKARGTVGSRSTFRRGSSAEFREHRSYAAGDDVRHIDWLAFARTGEPVMKWFKNEEDAIIRVVLDCSASFSVEAPGKFAVAKKIAAAIAYLALTQADTFSIAAANDSTHASGPFRGRAALGEVFRAIDTITARGTTNLAGAIGTALRTSRRPGALIVVSDFFDPGHFEQAIEQGTATGHDIAFVQVLGNDEAEPPYDGDVVLEDAETGKTFSIAMDANVRSAYAARLEALFDRLRRTAQRHRGSYVRMVPTDSIGAAVKRLLTRRID